jgi:hypothetical protein
MGRKIRAHPRPNDPAAATVVSQAATFVAAGQGVAADQGVAVVDGSASVQG